MKTAITSIPLLFFCICAKAQTDTAFIKGIYSGKHPYIQYSISRNNERYCISEILVNGKLIPQADFQREAFEINISSFGIQVGDSVKVSIIAHDPCVYKLLNTDVFREPNRSRIISMKMLNDALYWTVADEAHKGVYYIEQFRWNKWVKIGELEGKEQGDTLSYQFACKLHSGKNSIRIRLVDENRYPVSSRPVDYTSSVKPVRYKLSEDHNKVIFTNETMFELYDKYGNVLKRGTAKEIDVSYLKKDRYYLNYDSKMGELKIKKRAGNR